MRSSNQTFYISYKLTIIKKFIKKQKQVLVSKLIVKKEKNIKWKILTDFIKHKIRKSFKYIWSATQ